MLLTARLEIWLLGSQPVRANVGLWRGLANLLATGSFDQPLVEEASSLEELSRAVVEALSPVTPGASAVEQDGRHRVLGRASTSGLTLELQATVSHRHHPLAPAVALDFALRAEPEPADRKATARVAAEKLQALARGLRERLPVARLESDAHPPRRDESPASASIEEPFYQLWAQTADHLPLPAAADDWGGGALEGPADAGDHGGGTFGDAGDSGGGHF